MRARHPPIWGHPIVEWPFHSGWQNVLSKGKCPSRRRSMGGVSRHYYYWLLRITFHLSFFFFFFLLLQSLIQIWLIHSFGFKSFINLMDHPSWKWKAACLSLFLFFWHYMLPQALNLWMPTSLYFSQCVICFNLITIVVLNLKRSCNSIFYYNLLVSLYK